MESDRVIAGAGDEAAAFAAFSLLICSRRSRISDFFDSIVVAAAGSEGFGSEMLSLARTLLVSPVVFGVANFASSTSPSSTSVLGFEVDKPRELIDELADCSPQSEERKLT